MLLASAFATLDPWLLDGENKPIAPRGGFRAYVDPLTETVVTLLTNYAATTILPSPQSRFITRNRSLFCSSDQFGSLSPVRIDLHAGTINALTATNSLDSHSLHLDASEKSLFFLAEGQLTELLLANKRSRVLADGVTSFVLLKDANSAWIVRKRRLEDLNGTVRAADVDKLVSINPDGSACFVEKAGTDGMELWWVSLLDAAPQRLILHQAPDACFWSADGQSILFLKGNQIVRQNVRNNQEEKAVKTSSFASFSVNRDQTVFVGASRSKAQPVISLLTASGASELALCEHHASDPGAVSPVFSPDSRRIYFQSDRLGKPAIYSVNTESLVEPT